MNAQQKPKPDRRQVIKGAGVIGGVVVLLVGGGVLGWQAISDRPSETVPAVQPGQDPSLETLAGAAVSGGPGKDGIPSVDRPRFVAARDADFLEGDEPVFGLEYRGEVRAYPQQVLVWHEIVNDTVAGEPLAVTYCPLTGTVIGFAAPPGTPELTFGTTGKLVNSNLLMYDRQTGSEWPQLLGQAVSGPLKGTRLDTVPLVWTTWKEWRAAHPDTEVLSTDTGALRSYGSDPYGSYPDRRGYYVKGRPFFPVLASSDRFPDKDVVIGVRVGQERLAIHKDLVRKARTVHAEVAGSQLEARWDDRLDTARVFQRVGDKWEPADFLDSMWFAWYAFYPNTQVRQ
ncbi:DUF3179 domain-containing protein [Streptomyces sp. ISL-100]|uniref:DUF3179 domain-containing protein n=1 Tax=Streptomyces sp. ISL-100 TaxID=2819173 RepID=UPI001BEC9D7D|nr:DUF3179 domain-containing protein [Streptomyces sp. ISL-100]MBT2401517.1 DUF3179 domain-containing protein [Streptomyces sp. ISL-100]